MDTWNKRRARQLLYEGLTPMVAEAGFRPNKASEGFIRKIPGGRQRISVALWEYHPEYQFTLTLCIRLDEVEALCHPFAETPPQYQAETLTSLTQLEHLGEAATLPGRGVIYRVTTEDELAAALIPVSRLVAEKVLPFLDRHTDLASLDAAMNPETAEPPDRRAFNSAYHPYRGMTALAAAYLARNPRFEPLVTRYQGEMEGMIPSERAKFDRLVGHMRSERLFTPPA